ncbi:tyrosine-protein phosphatase [Candidatus Harpocratesius sp.]
MSYIIKDAITQIKNYFQSRNYIREMAVLGSAARDDLDLYSDIDLYLFGDNSLEWSDFSENPVHSFKEIFGNLSFYNYIPYEMGTHNLKEALWIIYLPINLIKVELHLIRNFEALAQNEQFSLFFLESRIKNPKKAVYLDKDGRLLPYLENQIALQKPFQRNKKFDIEARKFLNYYESFFTPFNRGDLYRAYLLQNLCFYKLATLFYIESGGKDHLYALKNLMNKALIINPKFQKYVGILQESSSTINPFEMRVKIDKLFTAFYDLIRKTSIPFSIPVKQIQDFNCEIKKKYPPFYKFRDFGRKSLQEPKIKSKKLYRSSTLTRYNPDEVFQFFISQNIQIVIDLRSNAEIKEDPYDSQIFNQNDYSVAYYHIPLHLEENYLISLESNYSQVIQVFQLIQNAEKKNIVLHCVAGTDRTGMIIALLYLIIGIPEKKIIEDFYLSVTQTHFDHIENLILFLKEQGGVESFFINKQVERDLFDGIRQSLLY